jgi:cell division protein FtsW
MALKLEEKRAPGRADLPFTSLLRSPALERLERRAPVAPAPAHGASRSKRANSVIFPAHPMSARHPAGAIAERRGAAGVEQMPRGQARPVPMREPPATQPRSEYSQAPSKLPDGTGRIDYALFAALCGLLCFGLVMVYSASTEAVPGDPAYWFRRELLWMGLGTAALVVTMRIPYSRWRRPAVYVMVGALLLMALVVLIGKEVNGAQRWLALGAFFSFQPSELAKLAFILYIADWLSRKGQQVGTFIYGLAPFALLTGVVLSLVMVQNDMGTAIIIAALAVAMFITAGARFLVQLLPTLVSGMLSFGFIVMHTPFRLARLQALQDPLNCQAPGSYQICQGLLALGSGGLSGVGLGASRQKAGYLPNPWTDSIFAIIGEELGFIGCALILSLLLLFAYRAILVGRRAPDMYGMLLATGIACWIATQAFLNIGSVIALIPFTGVPLPFISFGGSSLVTTMAAVGILLNISRYSNQSARDGNASIQKAHQLSQAGRENNAGSHLRRRDGRAHLPRAGRR